MKQEGLCPNNSGSAGQRQSQGLKLTIEDPYAALRQCDSYCRVSFNIRTFHLVQLVLLDGKFIIERPSLEASKWVKCQVTSCRVFRAVQW